MGLSPLGAARAGRNGGRMDDSAESWANGDRCSVGEPEQSAIAYFASHLPLSFVKGASTDVIGMQDVGEAAVRVEDFVALQLQPSADADHCIRVVGRQVALHFDPNHLR